MLGFVSAGRALHKFQELAQTLSLVRIEIREFDTHTKARVASGNNAVEDNSFDPELAAGDPESDLGCHPVRDRGDSFHKAATHAGISQVSPDRGV